MTNQFLDQATKGRNEVWRYVLTMIALIVAAIVSQIIVLLPVMLRLGISDINQFDSLPLLLVTMAPFPVMMLVLFGAVKFLHRRSPKTLITPNSKIDWKKLLFSAIVWFLLSGVSDVVFWSLNPGNYAWSFDWQRFLPYFLVSVVLIPIQTSTEELIFRGYMAQWLGRYSRRFILPIVLPAFIFMLLHGVNPEVLQYGAWLTLPFYFGIGLLLGWITLRSQSLELALGIHLANNLYASLMVTFPGSALTSPAIFSVKTYDPALGLIGFVVMAVLFLLILSTSRRRWLTWTAFVLVVVALVFGIFRPVVAASGDQVNNWDVTMQLQSDGSLLIHETVVYDYFGDPAADVVREISLANIDAIEVTEVTRNGNKLPFGTQAGQVELSTTDDAQRIVWHFADSGEKGYQLGLTYFVKGVVQQKSEGDVLEWAVIPYEHEFPIQNLSLSLALPTGIQPIQTPRLIGIQAESTIRQEQISFHAVTIASDEPARLRVVFPAGSLIDQPPGWQKSQQASKNKLLDALPVGVVGLISLILLTVAGLEYIRRKQQTGAVLRREGSLNALPPGSLDATLAGCLMRDARFNVDHLFADLIEMAQRRNILFVERALEGFFGGQDYLLRDLSQPPLTDKLEQLLFELLFHKNSNQGSGVHLQDFSHGLTKKADLMETQAQAELIDRGFVDAENLQMRTRLNQVATGFVLIGTLLIIGGIFFLNKGSEDAALLAVGWFGGGLGAVLSGGICWLYASSWKVLTASGVVEKAHWQALRTHLKDLIKSRSQLDLILMERDLPFAITCGIGADWVKAFQDQGLSIEVDWVQTETEEKGSSLTLAAVLTSIASSTPNSSSAKPNPFLSRLGFQ